MVSHANLIHHLQLLQEECGYLSTGATVTWMPYFHDYGLIEGLLMPLYNGTPCYVMAPLSFVKRPVRWLAAITKYRATHSQAPNFAYQHCVRRISNDQQGELDLSSWKAAGVGSEPIDPTVLNGFTDRFAASGFDRTAMAPAYGLAEATLVVSFTSSQVAPTTCRVVRSALCSGYVREALPGEQEDAIEVAASGRPIVQQLAIVDPDTKRRCQPDETGEIWVSDPSVAMGYWNRPEATEETFHNFIADTGEGPFLRTGDIGFLRGGNLFVSGRIKDIVIIRGMNHYPQDLEWSIQKVHAALQPDRGVAFSVFHDGEERLVIVQELVSRALAAADVESIVDSVRQAIGEEHGLDVFGIVLVARGTIPRTTSGKLQRQLCRQKFLDGDYGRRSARHVASWFACDDRKPQTSD